jgi:hypothetical protein
MIYLFNNIKYQSQVWVNLLFAAQPLENTMKKLYTRALILIGMSRNQLYNNEIQSS